MAIVMAKQQAFLRAISYFRWVRVIPGTLQGLHEPTRCPQSVHPAIKVIGCSVPPLTKYTGAGGGVKGYTACFCRIFLCHGKANNKMYW